MNRRDFLKMIAGLIPATAILRVQSSESLEKNYAMVVDVSKCIGCGKCVVACKIENYVPIDSKLSRTWIEGYSVDIGTSIKEIKVRKEILSTSKNPFLEKSWIEDIKGKKTFYVPKLCNHCANAPCIEVCPVYARFHTKDGVVLVDKDTCIGCKYCITACPYGATFLHPKEKVTDKCTFCYHRIKKGATPVCVLLCPTEARNFGKLEEGSKVQEMIKRNMTLVLKPEEGTFPRVFYLNLDMVVDL
ncbi:MAG: 4Fe-4S dicluster domain-containing protein [Archaeoglobaceae archaeon]|nr:4Fe-4S dicluster domain-containing protein [Archaeoglobaceae archaeon]MDW7989505.1 4Fe-4S dicluster domain-containing protein [Archaeoglobaceae archaeon]